MKQQNNIAGIKLEEINNDDLFPYTYFKLDRFAITKEELEKLVKVMSDEEYSRFIKGLIDYETESEGYPIHGLEMNEDKKGWCNNFRGFIQYRYLIEKV